MAKNLKFEFNMEEVFEGIEKGVVKQMSEMTYDTIVEKGMKEFRSNLEKELRIDYRGVREIVELIKSEVREKVSTNIAEEIERFKKETIKCNIETAINNYRLSDEIEDIKENVENRLFNLARTDGEEKITLTKEEYNKLLKESYTLEALERGGVDNWEWYSESISNYEEDNKEFRRMNK